MIVLGIESTAHTFGVGIVRDGKIVANVNSTYVPPGGGIHPRDAAEHHAKAAPETVRRALDAAETSMDEVDAVAYSAGPGLGPSLRVGATVARYLALRYGKPLVPVHHGVAHIEVALHSTGTRDPIVVLISGGHTTIAAYRYGRYRVFGETLDMAIGNVLDVFAREVGLGWPGVPAVERCASGGNRYIPLPYTIKGQDPVFAGTLSRALELATRERLEDVCFSLVETVYYMLAEVVERALAYTGKRELVLCGGVARSPRLQRIMSEIAAAFDASLHVVPPEYAGDNGAMIALTGYLAYMAGTAVDIDRSFVRQRWRIDEVDITWRAQAAPFPRPA